LLTRAILPAVDSAAAAIDGAIRRIAIMTTATAEMALVGLTVI
jgi:hypothetical protein